MQTEISPALDLVIDFANTNDIEAGADDWADPESLRAWLAARGLLEPGVVPDEAARRRTVAVREAVRELAAANSGGGPVTEALETLDAAARRARLQGRFGPAGAAVEPAAGGVDGAVGRVVAAVHEALVTGTWARVKACGKDSCRWLFFDRSRNRSAKWCAMSVCGNRVKAAAYRRRRSTD